MEDILQSLQGMAQGFLESHFFAALKIFMAIYVTVLIIDLVILVYFRNPLALVKQGRYGTALVASISKSDMNKRWSALEKRLGSGNVSEYKVAVLEADQIVDTILNDTGYTGEDMPKKLEQLSIVQPQDAEDLGEAHKIRNRIVFEQDFQITLDETKRVLNIFKDYLKKLEYFE